MVSISLAHDLGYICLVIPGRVCKKNKKSSLTDFFRNNMDSNTFTHLVKPQIVPVFYHHS